jgi:hypothetical protein
MRNIPIEGVEEELEGVVPESMRPSQLHYNKDNDRKDLMSAQEAERRFLSSPWPLINKLTQTYLAKNIYDNDPEPVKYIPLLQANYINKTQKWYPGMEEQFDKNPAEFFRDLASSSNPAFHWFGDFHTRLQNTCVSETPAERKIKHAKRMITKHRYPKTVVLYMHASSRKDVKKE